MNFAKLGRRGMSPLGRKRGLALLTAAGLAGAAATSPAYAGALVRAVSQHDEPVRHVLLISVDGMHQADLTRWIAANPNSTLAALAAQGVQYGNARTPVPSDSFPGTATLFTGATPGAMGVYYDDEYSHDVLPAGTTSCTPPLTLGAPVQYFEDLDLNLNSIDAGQGLSGLPGSILNMTGDPDTLIQKSALPVDPNSCKPIYPHQYLRTNTVFGVARAHGLRTAWSDKHPAYEMLNGHAGEGTIQDLFTPEINSLAIGTAAPVPAGGDWTTDNTATQQYDAYKVHATINEIDGFDHSGKTLQGVPAIFGMNFQAVSTGQKLPTSQYTANGTGYLGPFSAVGAIHPGGAGTQGAGGYLADGVTPGPVLTSALSFVDVCLGQMVAELAKQHLTNSTTIIVTAKHGQSPMEPGALTGVPDAPIIAGLNAAWTAAHPGAPALVAYNTDDDAMLVYLNDRSPAAAKFAREYLLANSAPGNDINGNPKLVSASGLARIYDGEEGAKFFGTTLHDGSRPDLYGVVQHGVVYTGGKGKIAEHGGDDPQDRNVPLLISGAAVTTPQTVVDNAATGQIAPTILTLLGLNPAELDAVGIEHTQPLLDGLDH